jgi:hypothetical protein
MVHSPGEAENQRSILARVLVGDAAANTCATCGLRHGT